MRVATDGGRLALAVGSALCRRRSHSATRTVRAAPVGQLPDSEWDCPGARESSLRLPRLDAALPASPCRSVVQHPPSNQNSPEQLPPAAIPPPGRRISTTYEYFPIRCSATFTTSDDVPYSALHDPETYGICHSLYLWQLSGQPTLVATDTPRLLLHRRCQRRDHQPRRRQ
jgi:hypothetical protein